MFSRRALPAFAGEGALLGIDDYLKRDGIDGSQVYLPSEWPHCLWQGSCYGLPLTEGNHFFFYNVKLLEAAGLDVDNPPTTWAELKEYSAALTTFEDEAIDVIGYNTKTFGSFEWLAPMNGEGAIVSEDMSQMTYDRPELLEALEWSVAYNDEVNEGYQNVQTFFAQTGAWETHPFLVGMQAMMLNHCYMFLFIHDYAPDLEYRVARLPHGPAGNRTVALNDPVWAYVVPSGVQDLDESWELLKYMCYGEGCKNFMRRILRAPAKMDLINDPWYEENMPNWQEWKEIVKASIPVPAHPVLEQMRDMETTEEEKALLHKVTPAEAVGNLQTQGQKLLDEWWETH
jgi:multiple sugar transport system substrate-binding protein